jgi:hypothetical protein
VIKKKETEQLVKCCFFHASFPLLISVRSLGFLSCTPTKSTLLILLRPWCRRTTARVKIFT